LFARDLEGGVGVEEPLAALRLFVRAIVGGSKWISVLALSPLLFGEGLGESTRDERATWRMAQIAAVGIYYYNIYGHGVNGLIAGFGRSPCFGRYLVIVQSTLDRLTSI